MFYIKLALTASSKLTKQFILFEGQSENILVFLSRYDSISETLNYAICTHVDLGKKFSLHFTQHQMDFVQYFILGIIISTPTASSNL